MLYFTFLVPHQKQFTVFAYSDKKTYAKPTELLHKKSGIHCAAIVLTASTPWLQTALYAQCTIVQGSKTCVFNLLYV
jgi:hypothetical protein